MHLIIMPYLYSHPLIMKVDDEWETERNNTGNVFFYCLLHLFLAVQYKEHECFV
jgi:hypothetical protein